SSKKDRKLHLSMYGKAAQLEKQMDAKLAWFQEKYSGRTHRGLKDMDFGTYPNCIQWWTKQPDIIPRALSWSNFRKFDKTEYQLLFGPDSIPILELTPTDKELKETWLIGSLSYIRGEDVPFIQSVKPVENVDKAVTIDDHISTCPTDSNTLLEDVDSLFKEVIDVRPDLVGRVGELRTKIVQTLASIVSNKETVVANMMMYLSHWSLNERASQTIGIKVISIQDASICSHVDETLDKLPMSKITPKIEYR
ncbi:hypothetical protein Tco_0832505, partial [Tanacetum coccineum]